MKNNNSYKSLIRQYMESKSNDLQDQIDAKQDEVQQILESDNKDWPRIKQLAEEANDCINQWALLAELIRLKKKEIAKELADQELAANELAKILSSI